MRDSGIANRLKQTEHSCFDALFGKKASSDASGVVATASFVSIPAAAEAGKSNATVDTLDAYPSFDDTLVLTAATEPALAAAAAPSPTLASTPISFPADVFSNEPVGADFAGDDVAHPFSKYQRALRLDRGVNGAVYGPYAASIAPPATAGRAAAGGDGTGNVGAAASTSAHALRAADSELPFVVGVGVGVGADGLILSTDADVAAGVAAGCLDLFGSSSTTAPKSLQSSISRSVASLERALAASFAALNAASTTVAVVCAAVAVSLSTSASPTSSGVSGLSCTAGKNANNPSAGVPFGVESPQRLRGDRGGSALVAPSIQAVRATASIGAAALGWGFAAAVGTDNVVASTVIGSSAFGPSDHFRRNGEDGCCGVCFILFAPCSDGGIVGSLPNSGAADDGAEEEGGEEVGGGKEMEGRYAAAAIALVFGDSFNMAALPTCPLTIEWLWPQPKSKSRQCRCSFPFFKKIGKKGVFCLCRLLLMS